MKINHINPIFLLSILAVFVIASCMSKDIPKDFPKISNAYYQIFTQKSEKYYQVEFELSNSLYIPESVILNKIEQKLQQDNRNGQKYNVNIIAESENLSGFRPNASDQKNGLIFIKSNGEKCFVPVNFKLK